MEAPEDKAEYLTTLFQKVYLSDIVERHKVRSKEDEALAEGDGGLFRDKQRRIIGKSDS